MSAPYYADDTITLHHGDALAVAKTLPTAAVQTIVTSPPYFGLRDYGHDEQLGSEATVAEYVSNLVSLFRELRRVLTNTGTVWLNLGDSYGPKKQLLGIPWRVAFALQDDGWILRSDIIWAKPSPMPERVTDRPTKAHEYLFLLAKRQRYYYDADAIKETGTGLAAGNGFARPERVSGGLADGSSTRWTPSGRPQSRRAIELAEQHGLTEAHIAAIKAVGMKDAGKAKVTPAGNGRNDFEMQRLALEAKTALGGYYREFLYGGTVNKRDVWTVPPKPFPEAHFATYPPELIRPCILAGSRPGDTVLDPFSGSGTTGMVAAYEGRKYVGIELNADYLNLSLRTRFAEPTLGIEAVS